MNFNNVKISGKIVFDPKDATNKHKDQAVWKKMAMVVIDGDITDYYSWFLKRRYNITLNPPLRGAHVTFISDRTHDLNEGNGSIKVKHQLWDDIKKKYNNRKIDIVLSPDMKTNGEHWWLMIPEEDRVELHGIRKELGLGRSHFGLHMSLGYANVKNFQQSTYIHKLIVDGFESATPLLMVKMIMNGTLKYEDGKFI
jgi:hypothetical protein